jgi:hypothetical protein
MELRLSCRVARAGVLSAMADYNIYTAASCFSWADYWAGIQCWSVSG